MAAIVINLVIEQGTDFEAEFNISDELGNPLNLTNYTVISTLKKSFYSKTSVAFNTLIYDAQNGIIKISMPHTTSSTLKGGRYVYDVVIVANNNGLKRRVLEGVVTVTEGVSV